MTHPLRTLLVSQGMIWAVALAVVPAAVIGGTRAAAVERARELGTDLVQVGVDPGGGAPPVERDVEALAAELGPSATVSGLRVAPAALRGAGLGAARSESAVWLLGCDDHLATTRGKRVLHGRYPRSSPSPGGAEAALEHRLAEQLAGGGDLAGLIGQRFWLASPTDPDPAGAGFEVLAEMREGARPLEIVGVIEDERDAADPMGTQGDARFANLVGTLLRAVGIAPAEVPWRSSGLGIYLPRSVVPGDRIDWLFIRVEPTEVGVCAARTEKLLVAVGRTPLIYTNAVWPIMTAPEMQGYLVLHEVFFALFVTMGLLVLANLLLLSGWQRRREIALRRAEGATRADIFVQFVVEGTLLAILGFVIGLVCGLTLAEIRVALDPNVAVEARLPWGDAARAGVILTLGAVVASAYPAWRASLHDPMSLLRRAG